MEKQKQLETIKKAFVTVMFILLSVAMLRPMKAEAAEFENIPVYVVDDMRDYEQKIGLSWKLDWNLSKETGVTEQCCYAKFSLAKDSIVRIKMSTENESAFAAKDYFRLYGNETMGVAIGDNDISNGKGDDYFLLKAGTYYVQCGSKLYMSSTSKHSTKIMIGAVPVDQAVEVKQTVSTNRKKVTITVTQKFATELRGAKWYEGKLTSMPSGAQNLNSSNSFTVEKNGWYTVELNSKSSAWNKEIYHYIYINVTGIGKGAKKGVTYKSNNLKYQLVKEGFDGTGTVMVTGMVKEKSSVTIPKKVVILGESYKVVKINSKAFYKKSKVKNVTIQSTYLTSIGKNAFKGINNKAVIKVPKSKYKAYKKMLTAKTGFAKKTMKIKR